MLACLATTARAEEGSEALPDPAASKSHEAFRARLDASFGDSFSQLLSIYDRYLAGHPDDIEVAAERCRFISYAMWDELPGMEGRVSEDDDSCSERLVERAPSHPAALLLHMEMLYGEDAVAFGTEALRRLDPNAFKHQRAALLFALAKAKDDAGDVAGAAAAADEAKQLDPTVSAAVLIAAGLVLEGERRRAYDVLVFSSPDPHYVMRRVDLFIELGAFKEALAVIERLEGEAWVPPVLYARALAGAGRTSEAREIYVEHAAEPERFDLLRRLFYGSLERGDEAEAVASLVAMRETAPEADWLSRHRLSLLLAFPSVPLTQDDVIGFLLLIALLLASALLPASWILPVHYVGLIRRARAATGDSQSASGSTGDEAGDRVPIEEQRAREEADAPEDDEEDEDHEEDEDSAEEEQDEEEQDEARAEGSRWGLPHQWIISGTIVIVQVLAIYLFAPAVIDEQMSVGDAPGAPSATDLARMLIFIVVGGALAMGVWVRRADVVRLRRCSWSRRHTASVVGASLVAILLVHFVSSRVFAPARVEAGTVWSTAQMLVAVAQQHGGWVLFGLVAVVVPLYEELVFRSVFLESLERHVPWAWANVLQAMAFTAIHDGTSRWPGLFVFGLIAGFITRRSGGLVPAVALHMTLNSVACLAVAAMV